MLNFAFRNPTKLIFGKGQLEKIKEEIPQYGKKVLVTYGGGSIKASGLYDQVMKTLGEIDGVEVFEFGGIAPNPRVTSAREAIEVCQREGIEFILAVGGGSVIDCTKLIASGVYYDGDAWDIVLGKHTPEKAVPFGTVLTLAATGSEMNSGSVITNWETKEKLGWGSPHSFPQFSVLDPENTFTVPRDQTVNGIVDMMAHVFEQYFHHIPNTALQDRLCEGTLKTIIEDGAKLVDHLQCYSCRESILYCGTVALNGYLRVGTLGDWASHQIEHAVSAVHDIAHGAGLAILFPNWMKHVMHENIGRFVQYAVRVWDVDPTGKTDEEVALEGIDRTRAFWKSIGAPTTFAEVGIDEQSIELMVEKAMLHETIGQFKKLAAADVRAILHASL